MGLFSADAKNAGSSETKKYHSDFKQLLVDGEIIEAGFVVARDTLLLLTVYRQRKHEV